MASVTLTIPDQHVDRVVHALCAAEGMEENAANARKALIRIIRRTVESVETVVPSPQVPDTDGIVT